MQAAVIIILLVVNIPVYRLLYKWIFKNRGDFGESMKYTAAPDIVSLFKGSFWKDQIGEMKIGTFIMGCLVVLLGEYMLVQWIINLIMK